jgi:cofilin
LRKRLKYIIFNIREDLKEIIVEKTSEESDYDQFLSDLPADQCRWAVYDFEFETDGKRNKLFFISWSVASVQCNCSPVLIQDVPRDFIRSPDVAKVKHKMLFASSRDAIRRSLDGIALEIQGTDPTEVSYETSLSTFLECVAICWFQLVVVLARAKLGTRWLGSIVLIPHS